MIAPWKESYYKLRQPIKRQRHHFADKGPYSQGYGFLVVMSGYESWTIEKAEHRRMYAFYLWCWWRLLVSKEVNGQSILKEINPEYPLEGLMLKLKLQYFGYLMWTANLLEKTLMLEKIEGRKRSDNREWDCWMASLPQWTWVWASSRRWWRTGKTNVL